MQIFVNSAPIHLYVYILVVYVRVYCLLVQCIEIWHRRIDDLDMPHVCNCD